MLEEVQILLSFAAVVPADNLLLLLLQRIDLEPLDSTVLLLPLLQLITCCFCCCRG